ncbi:HYC_CC_PP family protein [Owenweeksia hongkongensis]|uniref:HYC_CC_PP family protein n=1 Tax=Owenweeksia hongkongensis TaxID=253245 RepID=UPI003A936789
MKEIVSIFLAFQVLLSSMSFNIGMHFCGDKLQSFSLFDKATPCEHAVNKEASSCPFHANMSPSKKKGCCDDKEVKIDGQEHETTLSSSVLDFSPDFKFIAAFVISYSQLYSVDAGLSSKFHNYKPPLIRVDIPVFIQTFLI